MFHALVVILVITCAAVLMAEGVFSAAVIFFCTVLGGLVAFNWYEPLATLIETNIPAIEGYGDIIAIVTIFSATVTVLRLASEQLAPEMVEFPDLIHRGGGLVIGVATGWVLSGILICCLQTLPWSQDFWGYNYRDLEKGNGFNADRAWLAYVHRASGLVFDRGQPTWFDPRASFAILYHDHRRLDERGEVRGGASGSDRARSDVPTRRGGGRSRSRRRP